MADVKDLSKKHAPCADDASQLQLPGLQEGEDTGQRILSQLGPTAHGRPRSDITAGIC